MTRWSPRSFAEALTAEGVPADGGYIGKPIYLCAEATRNWVTFGRSGFPFTSPCVREPPRYDESLCPRAQEALDSMVILRVVESFGERDVDDMVGAIAKVAELLPPDREPS